MLSCVLQILHEGLRNAASRVIFEAPNDGRVPAERTGVHQVNDTKRSHEYFLEMSNPGVDRNSSATTRQVCERQSTAVER